MTKAAKKGKIITLNGGTESHEKPALNKRRIALVGTAPSSCMDAPYDDESWEIWTLGCNVETGKRITKLFELHTQDVLEEAGSWKELKPYLEKMGKDTILGHANPLLPDATPFPKQEIIDLLGNYFTSSIAWMIGYAILQKPDAIGLWGIDMMGEEEYLNQRACCEYLLGIARGMNITLVKAPESPLLRSERLYAFEHTALSAGINTMRRELNHAISKFDAEERRARDERKFYEGQFAMLKSIHRRYG
jgi:hypothetical protein